MRNSQNWLLKNRISVIILDNGEIEVVQERHYKGRLNCGIDEGEVVFRKSPICLSKTDHKYGKTLTYALVNVWDYKNMKNVVMPLHRLVYLQFIGDIPEGYDIDHIDNDTLNNYPENLQPLSRKDNIAKRSGCKNQYYYINKEKSNA